MFYFFITCSEVMNTFPIAFSLSLGGPSLSFVPQKAQNNHTEMDLFLPKKKSPFTSQARGYHFFCYSFFWGHTVLLL
jgi:hypothetical protein